MMPLVLAETTPGRHWPRAPRWTPFDLAAALAAHPEVIEAVRGLLARAVAYALGAARVERVA